jgi:large subunit ribosomal protein L10
MVEKKTIKQIPEIKKEIVKELEKLMKNKKTILIASIKNIPGNQFQEISKRMRGKAIVKVPKKSLMFRAIEDMNSNDFNKLKEKIDESFAILFSDLDSFELAGELLRSKTPAKAKVGQIAPEDIEIQAGPTDLVPGPAISELGAVGLKVQVEGGKLSIKENKVIVKKGDTISQKAADIMSKLDIKPFTIGFIPLCGFDVKENIFYNEINIDTEKTLSDLKYAHGKALPFAVGIGYTSEDTIKYLLMKAGAYCKKINRILTGEPEEIISAPIEEKIKEHDKEEPKVDAAAGLAGLFG